MSFTLPRNIAIVKRAVDCRTMSVSPASAGLDRVVATRAALAAAGIVAWLAEEMENAAEQERAGVTYAAGVPPGELNTLARPGEPGQAVLPCQRGRTARADATGIRCLPVAAEAAIKAV